MWMLAPLQMNEDGLSVHAQWFSCQKMEQAIMTSLYDVMRISHARQGREVYKENMTGPQSCCYCHLGVLVQSIWVHYQTTDPLPWLYWCSSWRKHNQNEPFYLFMHASKIHWRTLVCMTLVV